MKETNSNLNSIEKIGNRKQRGTNAPLQLLRDTVPAMSWATAFNARDTSPDIIALPSSPLRPLGSNKGLSAVGRANRLAGATGSPHQLRKHPVAPLIEMSAPTRLSSPSKSMMFDTPGGLEGAASGQSPWRIKVTVEAHPRDDDERQQSPINRKGIRKVPLGDEVTGKRQWKGTPVRKFIRPATQLGAGQERDILGLLSSPPKRPRGRPRRHPAPPANIESSEPATKRPRGQTEIYPYERGTQRGQRLSEARNELEEAIGNALGPVAKIVDDVEEEESADDLGMEEDGMTVGPGELTVTENEAGDFSMISVETRRELQNSFGIGSTRADEAVGEKSRLSISYLPSSPPTQMKNALNLSRAPTSARESTSAQSSQARTATQMKHRMESTSHDRVEPSDRRPARRIIQAPSPTPSDYRDPSADDLALDTILQEQMPQQSNNETTLVPPTKSEERRKEREERRQQRQQQQVDTSHTHLTHHTQQDSSTLQSTTRDEGETSQQYEARKRSSWRDRREERRTARQARETAAEKQAERMRAVARAEKEMPAADADLWVGEASQEIEEEIAQPDVQPQLRRQQEPRHGEEQPGLFAGEVLPPRRAKIPRTWRRSSGMDFMYSDSPERLHPPLLSTSKESATAKTTSNTRATDATKVGGDHNESPGEGGVLTPESSDEETEQVTQNTPHHDTASDSRERQAGGETAADFTMPDAEATTFLHHRRYLSTGKPNSSKPLSRQTQAPPHSQPLDQSIDQASLSHMATTNTINNNINSTGIFFQGRPRTAARTNPRRPRRLQQAMDLTDLLALNSSPAPKRPRLSSAAEEAINGLHERAAAAAEEVKMRSDHGNRDCQPVDDADEEMEDAQEYGSHESVAEGEQDGEEEEEEEEEADGVVDNLSEDELTEADFDKEIEERGSQSQDHSRGNIHNISRSYVEHLNKASPQKIKVRFNESTNANSNLLRPEREYSPLFGNVPAPSHHNHHHHHHHHHHHQEQQQRPQQSQSIPISFAPPEDEGMAYLDTKSITPSESISTIAFTQPSRDRNPDSKPGLLARIFGPTLFPSHVVEATTALRKKSLLPMRPPAQPQPGNSPFANNLLPTEILQQPYPPSRRARLRSRYGVLPSTHPWTLAHMRTLHRMHNSVFKGKRDSIVLPPAYSVSLLPPVLSSTVGAPFPGQDAASDDRSQKQKTIMVETEDAWIIYAFFQVLVNANVCGAMERGEVEVLGDGFAKELRDVKGKERLSVIDGKKVRDGDEIEIDFVAACLGRVAEVQRDWEEGRETDA
ncbi:hypothetical protein K431DRAFT_56676 [Polychaeton citri CBS 116435]|uniref:Uncharacterized protein n=1 Tax=Polychaeton citri CBS 116435 TaxID=1314669 RepID=A0A9P4UUP7_9PEZI|nr:hypothetical protein K431DRAFT_56676 [Polychaeton citri CBS 116435]